MLYQMMYILLILVGLLFLAFTVLISLIDEKSVLTAFYPFPNVGAVLGFFGFEAAFMLGFGLWCWVSEERMLTRLARAK